MRLAYQCSKRMPAVIRAFLAIGFLGLLTSPAVAMGNRGFKPKNSAVGLSVKLYENGTRQVNEDSFEVRIRDDNGQTS